MHDATVRQHEGPDEGCSNFKSKVVFFVCFVFLSNVQILLQSFSEKVAVPSLYIGSAWGQLVSNFQHVQDLVGEYILQIDFIER